MTKNRIGRENPVFELDQQPILYFLVFVIIAFYVGLTVTRPQNYISLIGIVVLILLGTIGSKYPHRVAAVVIRFEIGFQCFDFLGKEVSKFIHNADAGAIFVFGKTFFHI
ncbi:unnamed protein product [Adineta steineri]|uniref:Concentrative nucleoside transporter N-terminal domain-containing protein n=1 Tax=Adineta steineri TaxID=433720 RepID=A0A816CE63_9BILA|nr:unnamed protein product [Adineta steineri]CAF1424357.1 unnamed protein product [Adineta steineri]CAF1606432.1 unnamed protein product [Adineta steineri]CAF1622074.1 unnamed protein product [Adineta steineri]